MITKEMVENGYKSGVIRLDVSPNEDGIVCFIGDIWFFFGGMTAEEFKSVEDYQRDIPRESIIDDIFNALESFREDGEAGHEEFADEYAYYDSYLREHGIKTLYGFHYFWGESGFYSVSHFHVTAETDECFEGWFRNEDGSFTGFRGKKSTLSKPVARAEGTYFIVVVLIDSPTLEEATEQARKIISDYIHGVADRISQPGQ